SRAFHGFTHCCPRRSRAFDEGATADGWTWSVAPRSSRTRYFLARRSRASSARDLSVQLLQQRDVIAVSRHAGHDATSDRPTEYEEIAHDVEDLVTREFGLEPELGVHHPVVADQNAIVQASSACQPHLLERGDVLQKAERACGRDLGPKRLGPAV